MSSYLVFSFASGYSYASAGPDSPAALRGRCASDSFGASCRSAIATSTTTPVPAPQRPASRHQAVFPRVAVAAATQSYQPASAAKLARSADPRNFRSSSPGGPISATLPWSITTMLSASMIVCSRCAIIIRVAAEKHLSLRIVR